MQRSVSDGFSLAYDRRGSGPAVVLLHGWPGDRHDWRDVVAQLGDAVTTVVPDLRGFGESDTSARDPAPYGAAGQAASVLGLIDELALERPVVAGYDVGSRTAQQLARTAPERVGALVLAPPLPGVGDRVLTPEAQTEFWYQPFHRLELSERLLDGDRAAVRAYLEHFWSHWSGPSYTPDPAQLDRLAEPTRHPAPSPLRSGGTARARARSRPASPSVPRPGRTGSRSRRPCCGPSTTRCSRRPGVTGWRSSSPTSHARTCPVPVTSRRWRLPSGSPRRSPPQPLEAA